MYRPPYGIPGGRLDASLGLLDALPGGCQVGACLRGVRGGICAPVSTHCSLVPVDGVRLAWGGSGPHAVSSPLSHSL
eukprot:360740-Chlamydomonas_euryale.AAC.9